MLAISMFNRADLGLFL